MTVLVLAPHTDDGQFGCGGTIVRQIEAGYDVIEAAFSFTQDPQLSEEWREARAVLGIERFYAYDFPVRRFDEHRQEILDKMIDMREDVGPDVVLCPSSYDTHQDHEVIRQEAFRAFKHSSILGYELPWNNIEFKPTLFAELELASLVKKTDACACFKSQAHRTYASTNYILAWAQSRGVHISAQYAEAFEVIRIVL